MSEETAGDSDMSEGIMFLHSMSVFLTDFALFSFCFRLDFVSFARSLF